MLLPVTEHIAKSARHTTFYLACGSAHRPMIIGSSPSLRPVSEVDSKGLRAVY